MGYFLKKYWKITVNTANRPSQLVVVAKPGMYLGASLDGQSQVEYIDEAFPIELIKAMATALLAAG